MSVKIVKGAFESTKIKEKEYNGVIIKAPSFDSDYSSLCNNDINNKMVVTSSSNIHSLLDGLTGDEGKILTLESKIKYMISLYFGLNPVKKANVQLYTTMEQSCHKFHVDFLKLRLICTMSGPCTEIIPNQYVERVINSNNIILDDNKIIKPSLNDICLMKGELWPDNKNNGLVHRSPKTNNKRFVFSIDDLGND